MILLQIIGWYVFVGLIVVTYEVTFDLTPKELSKSRAAMASVGPVGKLYILTFTILFLLVIWPLFAGRAVRCLHRQLARLAGARTW